MIEPLLRLASLKNSYAELEKVKKNHIKLMTAILLLSMGLFFYFFSDNQAFARKNDETVQLALETVDPLHKIGQGIDLGDCTAGSSCENKIFVAGEIETNPKISEMLSGSVMEIMIPALNTQNFEVAAYLIAIAKKESNWGEYSPKKDGRDCYNYWGYRGKENNTKSGYSCFDSPEQAIEIVGNRIERLLEQNINTPAEMVVWKCGSNCEAAGGQAAANKWIADVALYYNKLNS